MRKTGRMARILVRICAFGLLAMTVAGVSAEDGDGRREQARREIEEVMDRQDAAWNRGDLEAFCADYTEDTVFISPTGVSRSRSAVLARYKERYPDRAAQGNLSIEVLEFSTLDAPGSTGPVHAATVVGRWTLRYSEQPEKETATGLTLLVFARDEAGEWKILRDASM